VPILVLGRGHLDHLGHVSMADKPSKQAKRKAKLAEKAVRSQARRQGITIKRSKDGKK
jgi:hypothetical protein